MKSMIKYNKELINSFTVENNGESVLKHKYYNTSNNVYFNRTATKIILEIEKHNTISVDDLLDYLSKLYVNVEVKELEEDLVKVLHQFWERGIISIQDDKNIFVEQYALQNGGVIRKCSYEDIEQILKMAKNANFWLYNSPYINAKNFFTIDSLATNLLNNKVEAYTYTDEKNETELLIFQRDSLLNSIEVLFMLTTDNTSLYVQHFLFIFDYLVKVNQADEKGIILNVAEYSDRINEFINWSHLHLLGKLKKDSDFGDVDVYQ